MKRKVLLFSALVLSLGTIYAQGEIDAFRLSQNDLTGTARAVSMGGAFGALGGDITGVAINPAGIGVYKTSEIVTTLNFQNTKTETDGSLGKLDEKKFKFNFDNLAFVTVFPVQSDVVESVNFGFSYNRLKNFDRKYKMNTKGNAFSMADYMAYRANGTGITNPEQGLLLTNRGGGSSDLNILDNADWLSAFGYTSGLIRHDIDGYYANGVLPGSGYSDNYLSAQEKGSIDSYDFNVGTTFSDIVSFGMSLSLTDIKYRLTSYYDEDYGAGDNFILQNYLKTEGSGVQVKAGVIIKPINEIRIGLAYHSPTWYNMSDHYYSDFEYNLVGIDASLKDDYISTDMYTYDYKLRTPDKWTASLAAVIGTTAIISADYEYTNYKGNMKLFHDDGGILYEPDPNVAIKNHYKGASTVRVGAEVRFTPQFSGRVGYAWMQSPLDKDYKDGKTEAMTIGADPHYTLAGDRHYITYGLGYRFTRNFYTDIAFVMRSQKDDLQAFYTENNVDAVKMKTNSFQGLLTLGYRF